MDFEKFDKAVDLEGLKKDIEQASDGGDYREVPKGQYEVAIQRMELKESKKGDPMVTIWFNVVTGEYRGSKIFMNQVITQGFQVHIVNQLLRTIVPSMEVKFESYSQYASLLMDVMEEIDGKYEFALTYGEKNGFGTFEITEVFEVE